MGAPGQASRRCRPHRDLDPVKPPPEMLADAIAEPSQSVPTTNGAGNTLSLTEGPFRGDRRCRQARGLERFRPKMYRSR
jgi:hypothetical protein